MLNEAHGMWNGMNRPSLVVHCSLSFMKVGIKIWLLFENGYPMCYKRLAKVKGVDKKKRIT